MEEKINILQDALSEIKILSPKWDDAKIKINKAFPDFENSTNIFLEEINKIVENDPQFICDFIKTTLVNDQGIITLIAKYDQIKFDNPDLPSRMSFIAEIWDLSTLFRIHAYIITRPSKNNPSIDRLKESEQIFSHFREFSITHRDKENIRKIRNCFKHQFSIKEGFLIDDNGKAFIKIEEVNELYEKIQSFVRWSKEIVRICVKDYYKLLFLLIISLISLANSKDNGFGDRLLEVKKNFPSIFLMIEYGQKLKALKTQKVENKKKSKIIDKIKRMFIKIKLKAFSILYPSIYEKEMGQKVVFLEIIFVLLVKKFLGFSDELKDMRSKLTAPEDIQELNDVIFLLTERNDEIIAVLKKEVFPGLRKSLYI